MNASSLLDQLLKGGRSLLESANTPTGAGLKSAVTGEFGRGALSGGALALLLGNKRVRNLGGKAFAYGGMAALGALAYRAYTDWQQNAAASSSAVGAATTASATALDTEARSRAVLKALVAAAKSDGHIEDRERNLIEAEIAGLDDDPALRDWLDQELRRPLDPTEVARAAPTPEVAAEMYLASLLVTDDQSPMERMYLDELARQLRLDAGLKAQLESTARQPG